MSPDDTGCLPLHAIVSARTARSQSVRELVRAYPEAAMVADGRSWLPIHVAASRCDGDAPPQAATSPAVESDDGGAADVSWMAALMDACPQAVTVRDQVRISQHRS